MIKGGKQMAKYCPQNLVCVQSTNSYEFCPKKQEDVSYFIQISDTGNLEIPTQKPDVESIFDVIHEIKVTEISEILVRNPIGKKVLVSGGLTVGIEYISKTVTQRVHFAHWDLVFQALITQENETLLPLDFDLNNYVVHICVEDLKVIKVDDRTVRYSYVLLIWLQLKVK